MALFELPLSVLNNIPGVSGVDDVELEIPQVADIEEIVDEAVLQPGDVIDAVQGEFPDAIVEGTLIDDVAVAVTDVLVPVLDDLREDIVEQLSAEIDAAFQDTDITVEQVNIDPDELADEIADELDTGPEGDVVVSFESVFGALSQDIKDGFAFALEDIVGSSDELPEGDETVAGAIGGIADTLDGLDPDVDVPGVDDIVDGVIGSLEELPGFQLLTDPVEFAEFILDEVTNGLVDEDVLAETEETIDEVL